jgi:phosphoribosylaminoimidazole-succinocarboxamide synthase
VVSLTDYPHLSAGKVRDLYEVDGRHLLVVASDRISAYDWVLPTPIPDKGRILTAMSVWWFQRLADLVPNHLVAVDGPLIPASVRGRAMLVRRLEMYPVECVARGYLTGSGLLDYRDTGEVCGIPLPPGLVDGSRLPAPIFTPATKAAVGEHDENIGYAEVVATLGPAAAAALRDRTLAVYEAAEAIARDRGIILADTKFEFGVLPGTDVPVLGDEVLTPDSSRFWPADQWQPGQPQPSYDKQFVRDWLTYDSGWDRTGPPPPLPDPIVSATRERYVEAYHRLTGRYFTDWPG